jgi:hypothetical protein
MYMWENPFRPSIAINEEAFVAHYNKCLSALLNRILANIAASGLPPEAFLALHGKAIVEEIQTLKHSFMQMLSFPNESYTNAFGVRLSKISLKKLHHFTYHSVGKGAVPGYN